MAYVTTGEKRSFTFQVFKRQNDQLVVGYPKTYDAKSSFPGYSMLTVDQAQKLSDQDYQQRMFDFYAYVEDIESGFDPNSDFSTNKSVSDAVSCQDLTVQTTTTTAAPTTTTTTAAPTTTTTTAAPTTTTTTAAPTTTTTTAAPTTTTTTAAPTTTTTTAAPTTTTTTADPLLQNLVAWYELDETVAGPVVDSGPNGLNGTNVGATINQAGKVGQSYLFTAADNDRVEVTDDDLFTHADGTFSISAWINAPSGFTSYNTLVSKHAEYRLYVNGSQLRMDIFDNGSDVTIYRTYKDGIITSGWHHLVVTVNGFSVKFYLDGTEITGLSTTGSVPTAIANTNNIFTIGRSTYNSQPIDGYMDQVIIYDKTLNPTDISRLYGAGNGIAYSEVVNPVTTTTTTAAPTTTTTAAPTTTTTTATPNTLLQNVGFWFELDDSGAGVASDESSALTAQYGSLTDNQVGKLNKAFDFNQATSFINSNYATHSDAITFSCWVKLDSNGISGRLIEKNSSYQNFILVDTLAKIQIQRGAATTDYKWITDSAISIGTWQHIFVISDGTNTPVVYVNGVQKSVSVSQAGSGALVVNNTDTYWLGNRSARDRAIDGLLDQSVLWLDAKTQADMEALYNSGAGTTYQALAALTTTTTTTVAPTTTTTTQSFGSTADYFVSFTDGLDTNDGLSTGAPWKTLSKVNSSTFAAGKKIALKAGDSWEETLTPPSSGSSGSEIIFGAYGSGARPKIVGSDEITGWTLHSGNIYKATFATDVEQVFLDGVRMQLARYPNSGFAAITTKNTATQFISTEIASQGTDYYAGASCFVRDSAYTLSSSVVTASSGQTLTIDSAPLFGTGVGKGFFLTNKLEFLTSPGQWYYDTSTNTLYLWTPNGDSPAGYTVRGSVRNYGIDIESKDYITFENIDIEHAAIDGIYVNGGNHISADNVDVIYAEQHGIHAPNTGATYLTVTNSYIKGPNRGGVRSYLTGSIIEDNVIEDIGQLDSMHKTAVGQGVGVGIFTRAGSSSIRYNKIYHAGYNGIHFWGGSTIVRYNRIDGACECLDDGGGIYSYGDSGGSPNSYVEYNIIENVDGNPDGFTWGVALAYGVYMDNNTANIYVQHNTINHAGGGVFLHEADAINVQYNTVMNCKEIMKLVVEIGNSFIYYNVFYATGRVVEGSAQRLTRQESGATAVYDNNTYVDHYNNGIFNNQGTDYNFASWKTSTGQDASSTVDVTALGAGEVEELFYNDTKSTKNITLTGSYRDLAGSAVSSPLSLASFESKILIKE